MIFYTKITFSIFFCTEKTMNSKLAVLFSILQILIIVNRIEGRGENICDEERCCNVNLYHEDNNWVLTKIPDNHNNTFELRCFTKEKADNCKKCELAHASPKIEGRIIYLLIDFVKTNFP